MRCYSAQPLNLLSSGSLIAPFCLRLRLLSLLLLLSQPLEEAVCMLVGEDDLGLEALSLLEVHKAVAHNY